jgi:hypothetical protein
MNYGVFGRLVAAMLVPLAVVSCGGGSGDDEAGSPTTFATVPTEVTFTGTASGGGCAGGSAMIIVVGGVAPYSIATTFPSVITFNTTTVGSRGGSFTLTAGEGTCLSPGNVVVTDALGNVVTVTVTTKVAAATTGT